MPCADVCGARALPGWTRHGLTPWYGAVGGTVFPSPGAPGGVPETRTSGAPGVSGPGSFRPGPVLPVGPLGSAKRCSDTGDHTNGFRTCKQKIISV
ncbi:hypothetical protein SUDANB15_04829 [Streptomyces sp. enrichment culture]